jgi:predicted transcriptional regulator YdeE
MIWQMTATDFGAERAYRADFELYDQRAMDPANASLDLFIGLKA